MEHGTGPVMEHRTGPVMEHRPGPVMEHRPGPVMEHGTGPVVEHRPGPVVEHRPGPVMEHVDVLVIGGGPVGITTALLMARRGLSVRVLERAGEIYDLPRAIVMDDEIQRVFQNVGLQEQLREITTPLQGAEFVRPTGERIIGLETPENPVWPLGHHPTVTYYQPELEAFLRGAAVKAGAELFLEVDVTQVRQVGGPQAVVHAHAIDTDGIEQHHTADWLIAADGAASPIRKGLGVAFIDQGFDQGWLVVDIELTRPVASLSRFVQQICDPTRPTTYVIGHADYRRWEFQLQPGETATEMVDPDRVWELLRPWLTPDDARLVRAVVYRFHATVTERMRVDRIFLAGDAAHQMPPFLGQGLCSGIRDASNLAWKLALVTEGRAGDSLLDTYGEERLPHAAGVVAHAVDVGRLIDQLSGREPQVLGLDAAYGGGREFPHLEHGLLSGDHPAVGRQLRQPVVQGQLLDAFLGAGFTLLMRAGTSVPADLADRWARVGASTVYLPSGVLDNLVPQDGVVVVRPDRYVAAVATDQNDFRTISEQLLAMMVPT